MPLSTAFQILRQIPDESHSDGLLAGVFALPRCIIYGARSLGVA